MGHSMGGIVATSLLPSNRISAILTMSAPHTLPPARFDARVDEIYHANTQTLFSDPTPMVSLCGGATDMMIPSESCILPPIAAGHLYRKTVFTSALEGAWTGVGHQEMVWCHQVRWRIARAALKLGMANNPKGRGLVLDKWLREIPSEVGNGDDTLTSRHTTDSTEFNRKLVCITRLHWTCITTKPLTACSLTECRSLKPITLPEPSLWEKVSSS